MEYFLGLGGEELLYKMKLVENYEIYNQLSELLERYFNASEEDKDFLFS